MFAVTTYFTGLAGVLVPRPASPTWPRCATARQSRLGRVVYGILALGWRGSALHWWRYEKAYLLLAGLATPLVVSVHTVVSLRLRRGHRARLALDDLPAVLRGRGHLLRLRDGADRWPSRSASVYGLKDFITDRHLDNCAKVMLATGLVVTYGYFIEAVMAVYGGGLFELRHPEGPVLRRLVDGLLDGPGAERLHPPGALVAARAAQPARRCS